MALITRDEVTGRRRSTIRFPDGSPPRPSGCRWCGSAEDTHGVRWSDAAGFHAWAAPTAAQTEARILAHIAHAIPQDDDAPVGPPTLLEAAARAFRVANWHIAAGCATCTPASRLLEMCADGQRLALAAVHALADEPAHRPPAP